MKAPKYDDLFNPLLEALRRLGGSASISELEQEVADVMQLSEEALEEDHDGNRTKFSYNLAWARTYLKRFGLLNNSSRGVWALTATGQNTDSVDKEVVKKTITEEDRKRRQEK